jgi:TonB family protein
MRTSGGHIHAGHIAGAAEFYTGGGDIFADGANGGVMAETAGGRIEFGKAARTVRALTGGGAIRIAQLSGATELVSSAGGVFLGGIEAPVRVTGATGSITAWFSPLFASSAGLPMPPRPARADEAASDFSPSTLGSELATAQGDIIVFLPREIALTIDARIESGANHHIIADPMFHLTLQPDNAARGQVLRAQCAVNGGGTVLQLKTVAGNIHLRVLDSATEQRLRTEQRQLAEQRPQAQRALPLDSRGSALAASSPGVTVPTPVDATRQDVAPVANRSSAITRMFEELWWGGIRVDPDDQHKRLIKSVTPTYPGPARTAGIEGNVVVRVVVGKDGAVNSVEPVSGNPVLARAAINAIENWRYEPALLGNRPVSVVTTVTVAFRLRR